MTDGTSKDSARMHGAGGQPGNRQRVPFAAAKAFGRGYEAHAVDEYVARCASTVDELQRRLQAAHTEIADLRARVERDSRSREVQQAISVLTTAQTTADNTIAEADAFSARVMAEAKKVYEDARHDAAVLEQETEKKARAVYEDALRRTSALESEAERRIDELTVDANTARERLSGQTAYLRTLRDATRTQMEAFLEGMLNHLAEEYGRAHPAAAKAAAEPKPPARRPTARGLGAGDMLSANRAARRTRFLEAEFPKPRNGKPIEGFEIPSGLPLDRG
jgi:hypothetical protein